jgi:demethylmenaquinone methyltransferase/2-methoxy-6-polyprenyl-1,4-benzoquinol methylase
MSSMREHNAALDVFGREWSRRDEFSGVWDNALHEAFADVAPYYDVASDVASLGRFSAWRRRFITAIDIQPGHHALDVCAGTNAVGIDLLRKQPAARVSAIDRSVAMQEVGRRRARTRRLRIESVIGDAHDLPFPDDTFDVATLEYATRHLRVVDAFAEVKRVLKPGGRFYHCDMLRPENPVVGRLYSAYLTACVSATAVIFRSGPEARSLRDYFVRAIRMFYSEREISELLAHVGFRRISSWGAPGGVMAIHRAHKD